MKAAIVLEPDGEGVNIAYQLWVGETFIAEYRCAHMGARDAQLIAEARDMPHREAMHHLTTKLGMCEKFAAHVHMAFYGEPPTTTRN